MSLATLPKPPVESDGGLTSEQQRFYAASQWRLTWWRLRANLLDELKKPYVVTARAKGLSPLRLLLKYPLRIAINPFISDIGSLLPQVISGSVIVSIVLSLPTTGPMLLRALKTQDMYLAGSFLMILALLAVVGVLLSDIALAMLDPRIRQGSGRSR